MHWESSVLTHPGHKRAHNEDAYLTRPELGLWMVADGMGGHRNGREASQAIVDILETIDKQAEPTQLEAQVQHCLTYINYSLYHQSLTTPPYKPMGSTVAVMMTDYDHCRFLWAGDTRIYLYRDCELKQISTDHSYVQNLIEKGIITTTEAKSHPKAHLITNAIGINPSVEIEHHSLTAKPGDRFLICSDGLYNELTQTEIRASIENPSIDIACQEMLDLVLTRTARDNITVMMVTFI